MTPEREEERDFGMDKRRGIDDHDYYGKGKGDKGGGDANDNSGKGMGKGGDSEKGKKGDGHELSTTLFRHKQVWITMSTSWSCRSTTYR